MHSKRYHVVFDYSGETVDPPAGRIAGLYAKDSKIGEGRIDSILKLDGEKQKLLEAAF